MNEKREFSNIAKLVRTKRKLLGISQRALGVGVFFDGTVKASGQFVSNVERGYCSIPPKHISRFSKLLAVDPSEIISAMIDDEKNFLNQVIARDGHGKIIHALNDQVTNEQG